MKNKKAFAITPIEIMKLGVVLAFGIFAWLVYAGTRDWINQTFQLSLVTSIFVGVAGLLTILLLVKYNPLKFIIGG